MTTIHHNHEEREISFCWIPSHIGIVGNEWADKAAKKHASSPPSPKVIVSDFKNMFKHHNRKEWLREWLAIAYNHQEKTTTKI